MNKIAIILLVLAICINTASGFAEEEKDKKGCRVKVVISADEPVKTKIQSYIKSELRSLETLGNIIITDDEPLFTIQIISTQGVYAVLIELNVGNLGMKKSGEIIGLSPKQIELISSMQKNYVEVKSFFLTFENNVRSACEYIVAKFDTDVLEPLRQFNQTIMGINWETYPTK